MGVDEKTLAAWSALPRPGTAGEWTAEAVVNEDTGEEWIIWIGNGDSTRIVDDDDAALIAAAPAIRAALDEAVGLVKFYRDRERHYAEALRVADGGQYRADWDGAIARVLAEVRRLRRVEIEARRVLDWFGDDYEARFSALRAALDGKGVAGG